MPRRSLPFEYIRRGYRCNLDADERRLVRRLIGEISELLTTTTPDDPKMERLFPPAYLDDADGDAQTEYQHFMRDELVASRLDTIMRVETLLADDRTDAITADDLDAFAAALNSVRLVLGTLLGVDDDTDDEDEDIRPDDTRPNEMNLYNYLSWLLECAVAARMKGWDSEHRET
jgi:hypothetical protein